MKMTDENWQHVAAQVAAIQTRLVAAPLNTDKNISTPSQSAYDGSDQRKAMSA